MLRKRCRIAIGIATLMCIPACYRPLVPDPSPSAEPVRDCPECPEMVRIPGGSFLMGDASGEGNPDELPVHEVRVPGFSISKYEISFGEWDACAREGGCSAEIWDQEWGRGKLPVINVRWDEAQKYVTWLSRKTGKRYRLPSEAEWEYAARAGSPAPYPTGEELLPGAAVCWTDCGPEADRTFPVGTTQPNAFGVYDLHGNVWEWVQDCWNESYEGAPTDGSAWEQGDCANRVTRGGGWRSFTFDLRSSIRSSLPYSIRFNTLGIRVVRADQAS